jgi:hypothetical protein
MSHSISKLRQYVSAQGVGILPRDLYANLRTAPVSLYGTRVAAGTAGVVTTLDEIGNAESLLVDSSDYRGWIFGVAVVWASAPSTAAELSGIIANCQIQFSSMGVAKNVPTGICSSVFGAGATTEAGSGQIVNWHRFPSPIPWDGTDAASYIQVLNNNTIASVGGVQGFTVYADAWLARATDEPMPGNAILFPDDCPPSGVSWPRWIEMLVRAAKVRASVRK